MSAAPCNIRLRRGCRADQILPLPRQKDSSRRPNEHEILRLALPATFSSPAAGTARNWTTKKVPPCFTGSRKCDQKEDISRSVRNNDSLYLPVPPTSISWSESYPDSSIFSVSYFQCSISLFSASGKAGYLHLFNWNNNIYNDNVQWLLVLCTCRLKDWQAGQL